MKNKPEREPIADVVRLKILSALRDKPAVDISEAVANSVTETLTMMLKPASSTAASVAKTVAITSLGAILGAIESGCDLAPAARGLMLGVLTATRLIGSEVTDTIENIASIVLRRVARAGGDLEAAATGLLRGSIDGAQELGINIEDAASAAASGALNAVGDVRSTAYRKVLATVTKPINGVTVALKQPALSSN